jgi:5'-nucleotidase
MTEKAKQPLILVVNDDGITAPGIRALIGEMNQLGEVFVVAPDAPQSGMGHAITLNAMLRAQEMHLDDGPQTEFSCSGTPVDCVKLACTTLLPRKPDLIVSGINHGSNSSINVLYSGTMSAAMEGALEGIPSVGFSLLDHSIDADFSASLPYVKKIAQNMLENTMPKGMCLNVNIPAVPASEIKGVKVCRQANGNWEEAFDERTDPNGKRYYWLTGKFVNYDKGEDTDIWALKHNYISLVPVQFDITAHHSIQEFNNWNYDA